MQTHIYVYAYKCVYIYLIYAVWNPDLAIKTQFTVFLFVWEKMSQSSTQWLGLNLFPPNVAQTEVTQMNYLE